MEGAVWHVSAWPQWIFIALVFCLWTMMVWKGRLKVFLLPVIFLLVLFIPIYKQADIFVSSKVDVIALRDKNGSLWLSTGQKERFSSNNWMRMNGEATAKKKIWPKEGSEKDFPLNCDSYGCRGEVNGQKLSVAFTNKAWQEDCGWADIVISQNPVPYKECVAPIVVDYFDVWRNGPHAVWLRPNKIKVQTVEEVRGQRLWTQTSANSR